MGNREHMVIARRGVAEWNEWRASHLKVQPDLTRIDLSGYDLRSIDFRGVGLFKANLTAADLRGANLRQSILIKTIFDRANLSGAHVYGVSAWDVSLKGTVQHDLVITDPISKEPQITLDNLEIAQFVHLLLRNATLRSVIDTITSKVVLILGRFSRSGKRVLDAIRSEARTNNLLPVLFDFAGPSARDTTETISTLAHLARFVVVDLSSPRSVPHELQAFVPALSVPVLPIIRNGQRPYAMFHDLSAKYPWVLEPLAYLDAEDAASRVFPLLLAAGRKRERAARAPRAPA
jgi:hypothetical protein